MNLRVKLGKSEPDKRPVFLPASGPDRLNGVNCRVALLRVPGHH